MEQLQLWDGETLKQTWQLGSIPIAVGQGVSCDVRIENVQVPANLYLIKNIHGSYMYYDLTKPIKEQKLEHLPLDFKLPINDQLYLIRSKNFSHQEEFCEQTKTETIQRERIWDNDIGFVIGSGSDARYFKVKQEPFTVGAHEENRIVLTDRAVSARHCRIEPYPFGLVIRDLESKNGTWVNGVRVTHARIGLGTRVRLGRTNLTVVSQNNSSTKARSRSSQKDKIKHNDVDATSSQSEMVACSSAMLQVQADVLGHAKLPWPVLVQGESGTGKELVARDLHYRGKRNQGPFVALNCGGLPHHLVESELFGHEKGAFTGAIRGHLGVFEQAQKGTLFLDEIGELPLDLQPRLLRVLETQRIRRVGGESFVHVDVRIVCATHRDLKSMVKEGLFREDLVYRIAQLRIQIPSLRERPEDIPLLCEHLMKDICKEVGAKSLSEDAVSRLVAYSWPGNVRELRNILICAAAKTPSQTIDAVDIERAFNQMVDGFDLGQLSVEGVREVVSKYRGNISAAARSLGVPRTTLRDRLKKKPE